MKHTKIVLVTLISLSTFFSFLFSGKKDTPPLSWDEVFSSTISPNAPTYRHDSQAIIKSLIDQRFPELYDKNSKISLRNFKKLIPNYWLVLTERVNILGMFITSEKCRSLKSLGRFKKNFPVLITTIDSNADNLLKKSKENNDLLKNDSSKRLETNAQQYHEMCKIIHKDLLAILDKIEKIDATAENYATKVADIFKELEDALEIYGNYTRIHFEIALTICRNYLG